MFSFFFSFSLSWTPAFHQGFAGVYANRFYPNITAEQREAFLLGSIYADGLDKTVTHYVRPVIREINSIGNSESDLYWFFMGILNHISIDTFAHAGKDKSFIVASGWRHHLSELTVCAWAQWNLETKYRVLTPILEEKIRELGIGIKKFFKILYPICYLVTKFPFHFILLPIVQKDGCPSSNYEESDCNFRQHFAAMMRATEIIMSHSHDLNFSEVDVKTITLAELQNVECCGDLYNVSMNISQNFPSNEFHCVYDSPVSIL